MNNRYASWKCDICNLTLKAKNKVKLLRLIKVHLEYHNFNFNDTDDKHNYQQCQKNNVNKQMNNNQ